MTVSKIYSISNQAFAAGILAQDLPPEAEEGFVFWDMRTNRHYVLEGSSWRTLEETLQESKGRKAIKGNLAPYISSPFHD